MAKLNPLIIPSIDYIGNPGLGYYDLYDTESKPVALSALMHPAVKALDYVELLLGPAPFDEATARVVDEYYVNADHLSVGILSFTVDSALIADSPPNATFYYRSYSGPFENQSSSDPRSVLVKRLIPGNPTIGAVYVNDKLAKPAGVPASIETATALTLTIAAWENMAAGDLLTLFWGGNRFKVKNPPLSAGQIGSPQTIVVPAALIIQAGDSKNLQVNYEVRDTVNNWSLYSQPAFVNAYTDINAPDAPIVLSATHEGSLYSLDLANLAGANVEVMVPRALVLLVNDILTLTWEGQNADGTPINTPVAAVLVTDVNLVGNFVVPYEYVAAIASGSARVFYQVTHDSVEGARSKSINVNVIGEVQKLAAPLITEASGSQLDPADTPVNATLVIPAYNGMDAGQQIIVTWAGYPQIGPPQTYIIDDIWLNNSDKGNPVVRAVDAKWVTAFAGGKLEVSYQVNTFSTLSSYAQPAAVQMFNTHQAGNTTQPESVTTSDLLSSPSLLPAGAELKAGLPLASGVLRLDVVGEVILLAPPAVDQQADGFLDPALVPTGATVRIPAYTGKGQGEILNMYWDGVPGAGTTGDATVVRSAAQPVNFTIGAAYIAANFERSVDVWYETVVAGKTSRSESLVFSIRNPETKPEITRVSDSQGDLTEGGTSKEKSLTLRGIATSGATVELFDGPLSKGTVVVDADGTWVKTLDDLSLGEHLLSARTVGGNLSSEPWSLTLLSSLSLGEDAVISLSDAIFVSGRPPAPYPPQWALQRVATGGAPPYQYSSSNPAVVTVDPLAGTVRGYANGSATITVQDTEGSMSSCDVRVTGLTLVKFVASVTWGSNANNRPWIYTALNTTEMVKFWQSYYPTVGTVTTFLGWPARSYWTSTNILTNDSAWACRLDYSNPPFMASWRGNEILPTIQKI